MIGRNGRYDIHKPWRRLQTVLGREPRLEPIQLDIPAFVVRGDQLGYDVSNAKDKSFFAT